MIHRLLTWLQDLLRILPDESLCEFKCDDAHDSIDPEYVMSVLWRRN